MVQGGGYDYVEIADGQCDSPVSSAVTTLETNDRYCGTQVRIVRYDDTGGNMAALPHPNNFPG